MSRTRRLVEEELIRVATQCFSERGYQDTTLEEICSQVNISRVTFYTYFESKAALLKVIFERIITAYKQKLEELLTKPLPRPEKLRQGMTLQITSLTTGQALFRLYFREEANLPKEAAAVVAKLQQEIERLMQEEIKTGIERGELIDENPYVLMQAYQGMCNWACRWYDPEGAITPEEIIRVFSRILESGMLTSKAQIDNGALSRSLQQVEKSLWEVYKELGNVSQQLHPHVRRPRARRKLKENGVLSANSLQR